MILPTPLSHRPCLGDKSTSGHLQMQSCGRHHLNSQCYRTQIATIHCVLLQHTSKQMHSERIPGISCMRARRHQSLTKCPDQSAILHAPPQNCQTRDLFPLCAGQHFLALTIRTTEWNSIRAELKLTLVGIIGKSANLHQSA